MSVARRGLARIGFGGIKALGDAADARGILSTEREYGDRIERTAGRHDAAGAQSPAAGLESNQVIEGGRYAPDPAVSVPSEKLASPSATATAEPELDPPLM